MVLPLVCPFAIHLLCCMLHAPADVHPLYAPVDGYTSWCLQGCARGDASAADTSGWLCCGTVCHPFCQLCIVSLLHNLLHMNPMH
jgi:hypothetical protein